MKYVYIGIAILVLLAGAWVYSLWLDYQSLKYEHEITLQNSQALKDSLEVAAGTVAVITAQVRDLKTENQDLKGKNVALQIKNKLILDSLHAQGTADSTIITDSTATVKFKGKQKFANFSGWTLADLKDSSKSLWDLSLAFDEIDTKHVLFKDTDGLWKMKSISLTDGARVKGISAIDDDTFNALQKYSPPVPPKNFGLHLQASTADIWGGIVIRYNERWYVNLNYRFVNAKPQWSDNAMIGLSYFLF